MIAGMPPAREGAAVKVGVGAGAGVTRNLALYILPVKLPPATEAQAARYITLGSAAGGTVTVKLGLSTAEAFHPFPLPPAMPTAWPSLPSGFSWMMTHLLPRVSAETESGANVAVVPAWIDCMIGYFVIQ